MLAWGVPSSSFSRMVPAVAVYLISLPSIFNECFVCTTFSSGIGGFFSSFGFSAGFSGAGCGGCCAKQKLAPKKSDAAKLRKRCEHFMGGSSPSCTYKKRKLATCGIVCESAGIVNRFGALPAVRTVPRFLLQRLKSRLECGPLKNLISQGAPNAPSWSVRRHSTTSRCCVGRDARPERGATKERRSAAPKDRRGIAKGHERCARQGARPRSRSGAGGERATSLVRRNRQGRSRHGPRNELRHGISSRLDQQNVCRAGAPEIAGRRKNQSLCPAAGRRAGNPREKQVGSHAAGAHCKPAGAHCRLRRHGAQRSLQPKGSL